MTPRRARLETRQASLGYGARLVSERLDLAIRDGSFTAIIGPNGCGKSTLLRAFARVIAPGAGEVLLDGTPIRSVPPRAVARELGFLPQSSIAPDGIAVADLVARGRTPHGRLFQTWTAADEAAVREALDVTGLTGLSGRPVRELSGGQAQRVWIAMLLAQQTSILLLDEPTTFLDIAHQIDVLELCRRLNRERGVTIVAVLHDLNQAARYADRLILMREGAVAGDGAPPDVVTAELVEYAFGLACRVIPDPVSGAPLVLPLGTT
ncbi:MAG: ABC transporter ATP-binding protein [Propionicimonas sp.]|nr:ABC transporter ATP-binding protein [Propionicimonas sp.]